MIKKRLTMEEFNALSNAARLAECKRLTEEGEQRLRYLTALRESAVATPEMLRATTNAYDDWMFAVLCRR
jgi:hypothetical protein